MSNEKNTATIVIGGETKVIKRLKAGKFYEAQKVILELIKLGNKISTSDETKQSEKLIDPRTQRDAKVKKGKIKAENVNVEEMIEIFSHYPDKITKFISICADMPHDELLKKAYPEEINNAFNTCLELNRVIENVKNSVAPIQKMGADQEAQK